MTHSYRRVFIHSILSTKNGSNFLNPSSENRVYSYIRKFMENNFSCPILIINGTPNHLHMLFSLDPRFSLAEIMKNLKGNSSWWINNSKILNDHFQWQIGYGAFSVSESKIPWVIKYIKNQKEHHKTISFDQEMRNIESTCKIKINFYSEFSKIEQ